MGLGADPMEAHKLFITARINALACRPSPASVISRRRASAGLHAGQVGCLSGSGLHWVVHWTCTMTVTGFYLGPALSSI